MRNFIRFNVEGLIGFGVLGGGGSAVSGEAVTFALGVGEVRSAPSPTRSKTVAASVTLA